MRLTPKTASFFAAAFVACSFVSPQHAKAQSASWTQIQTTPSPPALAWAGMTHNWQRARSVLFGGTTGGGTRGIIAETWVRLGNNSWSKQSPKTSPPGVWAHAMAYDSRRVRTVLFGGMTMANTLINSTWEWDGTDWKQITTANAPSPRYATMSYDSRRGKIVLFGGFDRRAIGETWEYDGKDWTRINTTNSPPNRGFHGAAFDIARGRTVIFGGFGNLNDTWEYDGKDWVRVATQTSPSGRLYVSMVYDRIRQKVVLFGGRTSRGDVADTREFDGKTWTQVRTTQAPPARSGNTIIYEFTRRRTTVFGGISVSRVLGDVWQYTGRRAPLTGSVSSVSLAQREQQIFALEAGAAHAGKPYLLLGSLTGTSPGIRLGAVTLPLQPDAYLDLTLSFPNSPLLSQSLGTLDANGRATARFTAIPQIPVSLVGRSFYHAYLTIGNPPFDFASNAVSVTLTR